MRRLLFLALAITLISCTAELNSKEETAIDIKEEVPTWAQDAIWYQIFPERFYNGDTNNDPQAKDLKGAYPGFVPQGWHTTPWTWEWHRLEPWLQETDSLKDLSGNYVQGFNQKVQLRRYGGDLAGVMAKLDYLDSLGITAIYFNPLNDAPSLHKYDARNWRHIDRNFGPKPLVDERIMAAENPGDPQTWQWTTADSLFLKLITAIHDRGMRLILDYSFNHTGTQFWAWQDLLDKQEASDYKDWYWTDEWDDPETAENEFSYTGWLGVPSLPEIKDTPYVDHRTEVRPFKGDVESAQAKAHIFNVARRWLDPNGDGDPSDGVDGYRLDVAAEMPLNFWRDFRREVRAINPEAYLIGEVWWQKWPDQLMNPKPYLAGDIFDGVMNYRWFRSTREFIMAAPDSMPVGTYVDSIQSYFACADAAHGRAWMNMSASHDAPRLATAMLNRNAYKQGANRDNFEYKIHKPDAAARARQKLFLWMQFTMPGAPQIYNGDEMGMWGEDDPGNRKPLIWPEFKFEVEQSYPFVEDLRFDEPRFDTTLFKVYQDLIAMRKKEPIWSRGTLVFPTTEPQSKLLVYQRIYGNDTNTVVINNSLYPQYFDWSQKSLEGFSLNVDEALSQKRLFEERKQIPALACFIFYSGAQQEK
jgi:glycosidase